MYDYIFNTQWPRWRAISPCKTTIPEAITGGMTLPSPPLFMDEGKRKRDRYVMDGQGQAASDLGKIS
jgi:hypothetical protein